MPILNVKVSAKKSPEMTKSISGLYWTSRRASSRRNPRLRQSPSTTLTQTTGSSGEKSLIRTPQEECSLPDIKITDETNTKVEKVEYILAAFNAFSQLLGDLHEVSYIYVQDVRAYRIRIRWQDSRVPIPILQLRKPSWRDGAIQFRLHNPEVHRTLR